MTRSLFISKIISAFLLVVFALSITPKRYLHNIFAKHIDNSNKKSTDQPYQLDISSYNCDTDNLVAESCFSADHQTFTHQQSVFPSSYIIRDISFSSIPELYSRLRGPPVNI